MAKPSPKKALQLVRDFESSNRKYLEANVYDRWRRNEHMYRLEHENTTLTNDPRYKHRSKLYIPKTRNAIRRILASIIGTYFSNPDVINLNSRRTGDQRLIDASQLLMAAVNYRLTHTVKFFTIAMFAILDVLKYGRGVVTMGWDFEEEEYTRTELVEVEDENGEIQLEEQEMTYRRILKDEPNMRHVKIWNIYLSPSANPIDPINTSPVLIEKMPIFLHEVKDKIKSKEWKKPKGISDDEDWGEFVWKPSQFEMEEYGEPDIARDEDSPSWMMIEVWKCFVKFGGKDWYFISLKGNHALTDLEEVEEKFPCRGRPYIMGGSEPDTGKVWWQGIAELTESLQREINAIRNQRRDNVTLALNKKILIRNTAGIDVNSLLYSRPGAPITGDDISDLSIRELVYQDVTSSSFKESQETERWYEETSGITPYNMGVQRPGMNQTATGVSILSEEANTIISMIIRILNETFMIPTLQMVVQFEQLFETEEVLRQVAQDKGIDFDMVWTREAIENQYDIEVNAGVGSTSREARFRSLGMIIDRAMAINAQYAAPVMNVIELVRDALPLAGHMNPDKYINEQVIQLIMSKFGQVAQGSLANPMAPPPQLLGPGQSGGNQIESMQGAGGDNQIYR